MNIAALISGGVDSAVAVHCLLEQGHTPHLFYIRIGMDNGEGDCSADEDIEMCTLIARRYNLPFDIVSLHQEYWDNVMEYALRTVKEGLTPNPDIMCNKMIKFGFFEERWGHEFDKTATGHYASTTEIDGKVYLSTAVDPVKDQTDFLARISYDQLSHLMFPIGRMPKKDVREIGRHLGEKTGPIIEIETGRKLGEHHGYWFHTIGQRKGLGLSGGPWYVVKKNIHDNVIYVSNGYDCEKQYGKTIHLDEMHFISGNPWPEGADGVEITFKNRHAPSFTKARLTRLGDSEYIVEAAEKIQGIAPGQFGVIYDKDSNLCYGSGIITGRSVVVS